MDRRVKERLIGASILVALIVLVVPELLSGPKPAALSAPRPATAPEPTRNVTVDLATSKAPANSEVEPAGTQGSPASLGQSSSVSAAEGAEPAPATPVAAPPVAVPPVAAPPVVAAPAATSPSTAAPARPAAVETAVFSPISSRAAWAVQLGSFANRANAENLSHQLKGQGFPVYVLPGGSGASVRYRVRVGPLANRDSAQRTAAKLKSIGHDSSLVAPAG
jgi:DedD protein